MPFKILVAEDDIISKRLLVNLLLKSGYDVTACQNGTEAWEHLNSPDGSHLAILDWNMPGMQGIEICRKIREQSLKIKPYLIILTASRNEKKDVIEIFRTGTNDYMEKPFDVNEVIARVKLGEEHIKLQVELADRIRALEEAHQHIKTLQGILPICMHCHNIRNDSESWERLEDYISRHTDAQFSHGICPKCAEKLYPDLYKP
ncbi:MAG: response regulator transcription factor [Victivallales bacterium]|jgi:DNA-binding response OmpR family regulator